MTLIVFFIFGAVVLGAGAMLSPAYPTAQPRVGLNASLALALIAGGAVFYGTAAGWNTLVVDYMLFLLVTSIFLGGTLSFGQKRGRGARRGTGRRRSRLARPIRSAGVGGCAHSVHCRRAGAGERRRRGGPPDVRREGC
ncbi:MAG: hypothetical protein HND48_26175 [Chloroflexi bacterium]|nr:hypothetical protein [Chloroflexota bacterium]